MSNKTLILYASVDGQTKDICHRIKDHLADSEHLIEILPIQTPPATLEEYGKVILASSIRYGKHDSELTSFVIDHTHELSQLKSAFISVNLVARKEEKANADTNPYVKKFFKKLEWKPNLIGVFAGKLDYQKYSFWDKWLIRIIMFFTDGPLFPPIAMEFTDWKRVRDFSQKFSRL